MTYPSQSGCFPRFPDAAAGQAMVGAAGAYPAGAIVWGVFAAVGIDPHG